MKKRANEQRLPKFKATTLSQDELESARGGMMESPPVKVPAPTGSTMSVCHIDGTTDCDPGGWV